MMQSFLYKAGLAGLPSWSIDSALALLIFSLVLKYVASAVYTSSVQRLLRNLKRQIARGTAGVQSALTSPYEREVSESSLWSWTLAILMYAMSATLLFYAAYFVFIAFNLLEPAPVMSLLRLLFASFVALIYALVAKMMKVAGDKVRHKLSQRMAPQSGKPGS